MFSVLGRKSAKRQNGRELATWVYVFEASDTRFILTMLIECCLLLNFTCCKVCVTFVFDAKWKRICYSVFSRDKADDAFLFIVVCTISIFFFFRTCLVGGVWFLEPVVSVVTLFDLWHRDSLGIRRINWGQRTWRIIYIKKAYNNLLTLKRKTRNSGNTQISVDDC